MALNKRRNASVSASASTAPAQSTAKETSPTPAPNAPNSDFTALQTALASIVQLVTQLNETVTKQASEISDITARLDAIEAAMDEDGEDDEDEDDEDDEDEDDEDGDDYTVDDIDPAKVNDQLHQFKADEQKEILSLAMKSLGTNRLNPRIIAKDANAAYAVAEVLCSEKFGCDVEDMVKD